MMRIAATLSLSLGLACPNASALNVEGGAPKRVDLRLPRSLATNRKLPAGASVRVRIGFAPAVKGGTDEFSPLYEAVEVAAPKTVPGSAAGARKKVGEMSDEFAPLFDAVKDPQTGQTRIYFVGSQAGESLPGGRAIGASGSAVRAAAVRGASSQTSSSRLSKSSRAKAAAASSRSPAAPARLSNPGELYERAYREALAAAKSHGIRAEQVHFGAVEADIPMKNGNWDAQFTFYAMESATAKTGRLIYVSFYREAGRPADTAEVTVFYSPDQSPVYIPVFAQLDRAGYFVKGSFFSPDQALVFARRQAKGLGSPVAYRMSWRRQEASGDIDLWYEFTDFKTGAQASVNARTGETGAPAAPALSKPSLWRRFFSSGKVAAAAAAVLAAVQPALAAPAGPASAVKVGIGAALGAVAGAIVGFVIGFGAGFTDFETSAGLKAMGLGLLGALIGTVVGAIAGAMIAARF